VDEVDQEHVDVELGPRRRGVAEPGELFAASELGAQAKVGERVVEYRAGAEPLLLFHHDPLHSDDFLDAIGRGG